MSTEKLRAALKHGPTASLYRRVATQKKLLQDWVVTHLITSSTVVDTPYGFRLAASRYHANRQMQTGTFEPEEVALIQKWVGASDLFVDVGANIGYYTCLAASAGKPVLAFEPQPRNLVNLYENIRLNHLKDVEVFPLALGPKPGVADLYGSSGPSASLLRGWGGNASGYKQAVAVSTMDTLIASRLQGRNIFIKVDVEGFEYQLLLGAKQIVAMQPKPTWLIEICLDEAHPGGVNQDYEKTLGLFFDAGYRITAADAHHTEVSRDDAKRWQVLGKTPLGTYDYLIHS